MTKKDTQFITVQPDQYLLNPDGTMTTIAMEFGILQKLQVNVQ